MQIRVGYELIYDCPQPTPMILTLHIHFTRVSDIIVPDHLITSPSPPMTAYQAPSATGVAGSSRRRVRSDFPLMQS